MQVNKLFERELEGIYRTEQSSFSEQSVFFQAEITTIFSTKPDSSPEFSVSKKEHEDIFLTTFP